jgi:hypothetical protein
MVSRKAASSEAVRAHPPLPDHGGIFGYLRYRPKLCCRWPIIGLDAALGNLVNQHAAERTL